MSKRYKNVSQIEQLGIAPGETGEADIPKDQEERMVERGAIEVAGGGSSTPAPEKPVEPEAPAGGKR